MIEVKANTILAARDFGRIRTTTHDRGDSHSVHARTSWLRTESNAIADLEIQVSRQALIDRNRALGPRDGRDGVDALSGRSRTRNDRRSDDGSSEMSRKLHTVKCAPRVILSKATNDSGNAACTVSRLAT